jgi:hypothetical protein
VTVKQAAQGLDRKASTLEIASIETTYPANMPQAQPELKKVYLPLLQGCIIAANPAMLHALKLDPAVSFTKVHLANS